MWRKKKRSENKAEKSLDTAAIYSLERKERLRSVGAYGVLAGLFLGRCSYWVTRREQRTVDPHAIRFLPFFFFLNTFFCSLFSFIGPRAELILCFAHIDDTENHNPQ